MAEQQNAKQQNAKEPDLNQLLKVRREKLAELQAAGKDPFQITKYDVTAHSEDVKADYAEWEGKEVSIAGRMMSKRVMGKASFCNVQDLKGNIQCYVARDDLGEEAYKDFKRMDIGDIVGIKGIVFQEPADPSGEISRSDQHGRALPSALYRPDHERGREENLRDAFPHHQLHPSLLRRTGLLRGRNPDVGGKRRRRCCKTV